MISNEIWVLEMRSEVYPEWTPMGFEFWLEEEDVPTIEEARDTYGLAHSKSEFRATKYVPAG